MDKQPDGEIAADLEAKLEAFRLSDTEREALMKDLLNKLHEFQKLYRSKCDDLESEVLSRRSLQSINTELRREVTALEQQTESNAFILALIDGDGAIFQDRFITAGAEGGSEAGHTLYTAIKQHVYKHCENAAMSWPVMVQIYCNFDGLSRKLAQIGTIKSPNDFTIFAREFNLSQPLFNLVDVGSGKERADHKIKEMLRLYISNPQCKHLIFGGCHDNGYLPNLGSYKLDQNVIDRLTLLETTPAERGYKQLGYSTTIFPSVFRSEQLPNARPLNVSAAPFTLQSSNPPNTKTRLSTTSMQSGGFSQALSASGTGSGPAATSTYASVGAGNGAKEFSIVPTKTPPALRSILLNKYDERIDPDLPRVDPQSVSNLYERIKRQKVCNSYHIHGYCPNMKYCPFEHGDPITGKELIALRQRARGICCTAGSDCRSFDCFFGHHCPRNCSLDDCIFQDLHNIDLIPARKLTEDNKMTVLFG